MSELKRVILTQDNLTELEEQLKQFFMVNGIPVYEDRYINTTMDEILDFKHEGKNHCGTLQLKAYKVEVMESHKIPGLTLHYWEYNNPKTPGFHWFELGTEFVFDEELFYVKTPCKDYVVNKYDYTVHIFRASS